MKKNKPIKNRRQKTAFEKEQTFIKTSTNILLVTVIIFAIIVAFKNSFGNLNLNDDGSSTSLTALTNLSNKVDTSKLITNQLSDQDKPALINKIKSSNLDILSDDEFDYSKYNANNLNIDNDLSLSANEVGLLYSYLFVNAPDAYDTILYEISITHSGTTTIIKTVATINFHKLFTSKAENISDEYINSLPKRVYLTNTTTISNGTYTYSQVLFNNLSSSESKEINNLVKSVNSKVNLNEYVPQLIIKMINHISTKTSTTYTFNNDNLIFKKDATN